MWTETLCIPDSQDATTTPTEEAGALTSAGKLVQEIIDGELTAAHEKNSTRTLLLPAGTVVAYQLMELAVSKTGERNSSLVRELQFVSVHIKCCREVARCFHLLSRLFQKSKVLWMLFTRKMRHHQLLPVAMWTQCDVTFNIVTQY